jgi:hypothetical protein
LPPILTTPLHVMLVLSLLVFIAIVAVEVWAIIAMMFRPGVSGWLRFSYWLVTLLVLVATVAMTGFFSYYWNPNTHVFGWPIPRVIFQRDTPTSPWLDFVGPTIVLAYPMNFILYMFVPSVVFLWVAWRRKDETRNAA